MAFRLNRAAPNLIVLCVDSYENDNFTGRFYHKYQFEPVNFTTTVGLQLQMDRFFDAIHFPQPSTIERRITPKPQTPDWKGRSAVQETDIMLEQKGSIATFVVHVQYRQNATWQGKIIWSDKKIECSFRSALEMLKLIDQALDETTAKNEEADHDET